MNYIREAEKYLYYYRDLKYSLERLRREIAHLKWGNAPKAYPSINYDGMPHQPICIEDSYNVLYRLQLAVETKQRTEEKIDEIDSILTEIDKDPGCENFSQVLKMWYVERLPKEKIAELLGYSPYSRKSIYKLKNSAIRKFAIRLFGLPALEVI